MLTKLTGICEKSQIGKPFQEMSFASNVTRTGYKRTNEKEKRNEKLISNQVNFKNDSLQFLTPIFVSFFFNCSDQTAVMIVKYVGIVLSRFSIPIWQWILVNCRQVGTSLTLLLCFLSGCSSSWPWQGNSRAWRAYERPKWNHCWGLQNLARYYRQTEPCFCIPLFTFQNKPITNGNWKN